MHQLARDTDVPGQPWLSRGGHNQRPMRKLLLSLLLPIFLLLSQQGAVVHAMSHLADDMSRVLDGQGKAGHPAGDLQCEACLAFAHLAGVASAHVVPPALLCFSLQAPVNEAPVFIAADAPTARSRGPPRFL